MTEPGYQRHGHSDGRHNGHYGQKVERLEPDGIDAYRHPRMVTPEFYEAAPLLCQRGRRAEHESGHTSDKAYQQPLPEEYVAYRRRARSEGAHDAHGAAFLNYQHRHCRHDVERRYQKYERQHDERDPLLYLYHAARLLLLFEAVQNRQTRAARFGHGTAHLIGVGIGPEGDVEARGFAVVFEQIPQVVETGYDDVVVIFALLALEHGVDPDSVGVESPWRDWRDLCAPDGAARRAQAPTADQDAPRA